MDLMMGKLEAMTVIFKELSLENQSRLLECSQIAQIAENAVKNAFPEWQGAWNRKRRRPEKGDSS
jgi:hypothetical protein